MLSSTPKNIITWLPWEDIEPQAQEQIQNIASLPIIFKHVAVMPDCHLGKGATVGTVIATKGAVIPAAVGVDIGCGMIAVRTTLDAAKVREKASDICTGIARRVPMSAGHYNDKLTLSATERINGLRYMARNIDLKPEEFGETWERQLGSLGSGNHFIEVLTDEQNVVWVVLHSGSRGVGNRIAQYHITKAKEQCEQRHLPLPNPDLAWLADDTPEFSQYIKHLHWAQEFAMLNRMEMMERVLDELSDTVANFDMIERISCHHNFTQEEMHFGEFVWLTRKGAIAASHAMKGIIPGSMGTAVYIVSGRGNADSFQSAPHGAGRRLSRGQARRTLTMDALEQAMKGIEWRKRDELLDESPDAYKDINEVIAQSDPLVRVEHRLSQIINVKGD